MGGELCKIRKSIIDDYEQILVNPVKVCKGVYSFTFIDNEKESSLKYNSYNNSLILSINKDTDMFLSSCIKSTVIINLGLEPDYVSAEDNLVWFDPFCYKKKEEDYQPKKSFFRKYKKTTN